MQDVYKIADHVLCAAEKETSFASIALYGTAVQAQNRDDAGRCFPLKNESGTGEISLYPVFPGIELVYNDMHMAYCNKNQAPAPGVLEINYCREGRCECRFGRHHYCYMAAGDLSLCFLHEQAHQSEFPTAHYHGITITVDLLHITEEMQHLLQLLSVDLQRIKQIAAAQDFTILRTDPTIDHIFSELYTVPEAIRGGYIRLKVLELLLVLTAADFSGNKSTQPSIFPEAQIEVIKQIHAFLIAHYAEHYTIDELSARFEISPTAMKKCFRGVYGDAVYSYMKTYRLQIAERLLKETRLTVSEIAAQIGFLNPNKFTAAFCTMYGVSPTVYRRNVQSDRKQPVR